MKKQAKLIVFAIAFASIFFASCNHDLKGTVKGNGIKGGETLTIKVNSDDNIVRFENSTSKSARTIISDSFDLSTAFTYYLWGTAQTGETLKPEEVAITDISDDNTTGKVILGIDCLNWDLTLAAVQASDVPNLGDLNTTNIEKYAVLKANGTVDMMFTNEINFTLSPKGLTKPGTINLKLARASNWTIPDGYIATAKILDITTGKPILGGEQEDQTLDTTMYDYTHAEHSENFNYFQDAATKKPYTANNNVIKPGTYLFQVEFTSTADKRTYVWNDTLIILPGSAFNDKTITIPNLIGTKPGNPGKLTAKINNDGDKEHPGLYTVTFNWDDATSKAIKNETNFALELIEIPDTILTFTKPTDDATWKTLYDEATVKPKFDHNYFHNSPMDTEYYDSYYKSGSLLANNYEVTLYFQLGKRYLARIFAENNAGRSETASYAVIDARDIPGTAGDTTYDSINMYRVTYHLQGGTWKDGDTEQTTDVIKYWNKGSANYTVIEPNGDGTAGKPKLTNGDVEWGYWLLNVSPNEKYPSSGDPATLNPYEDWKNLDLYAVYARDGVVNVYKDIDYDISAAYVAGFGKDAGGLDKDATNEYSKGERVDENFADATLTLTLPSPNNDTDPTWKYDYVMLQITYGSKTYYEETQEGKARGEANTFTIPMKNIQTGPVYNCKVTATYKKTTVSYPFTLLVTD